jgi:hypothetical protein
MRISVFIGCLIFTLGVLAVTLPAGAADGPRWRAGARGYELPFPRSERAQSVWEAGACWSDCGAQCAWGQNACLKVDEQGQCLAWTDACDRFCLKQCRTSGGPLLSITD